MQRSVVLIPITFKPALRRMFTLRENMLFPAKWTCSFELESILHARSCIAEEEWNVLVDFPRRHIMSIWFWKSNSRGGGNYYSITIPFWFTIVSICMMMIVLAIKLYPIVCLLGACLLVAIGCLYFLRRWRKKTGGNQEQIKSR
jgi:hypothetical protein